MTPVNGATTESHNGSVAVAMPTTAEEGRKRVAALLKEDEDAMLELRRLDLKIQDAEFVSDERAIEQLEAQRARLVRRRERRSALCTHIADELMPALLQADRRAKAAEHLAEAQRLENLARPLRRRLRDALVDTLRTVQALDDLRREHREHENAYASAHAALQREANPNVYKHADLPVGSGMREHAQGVKALLNALKADTAGQRDPEHLRDVLDRALMPYTPALPFALDEEED